MIRIVGISGNLSQPSRTRALVQEVLERARAGVAVRADTEVTLIDIASFAPALGSTVSYDDIPEVVTNAFRQLAAADLIVIGTPVFKASYTGLLKHFFDLVDPKSLAGKVGVLVATGGSDQHASVLEYQLRPLASFFGIVTAATAIYARDTDFVDHRLTNEAIGKRIDHAVTQAIGLLPAAAPVARVAA